MSNVEKLENIDYYKCPMLEREMAANFCCYIHMRERERVYVCTWMDGWIMGGFIFAKFSNYCFE
jgi:hypothetical protein